MRGGRDVGGFRGGWVIFKEEREGWRGGRATNKRGNLLAECARGGYLGMMRGYERRVPKA